MLGPLPFLSPLRELYRFYFNLRDLNHFYILDFYVTKKQAEAL